MIFFYCAVGLCALYALVLVFAYLFAERLIFPTPKSTYTEIEDLKMLPLPSGEKIATLLFENTQSENCIIYSHGNGEDLGKISPLMREYVRRFAVNVLAYDYLGYGVSEGRMTQPDLPKCATAVYKYATTELGFKPENIFFVGYSLGSVPTAYLASTHPEAKGCVIIGGISKGVKTLLPYNIVPWEILNNLENVSRIKIPTLLLHGTRDNVVHIRCAYENLQALPSTQTELVKIPDYGHYPLFETDIYWDKIKKFIKSKK